MDNNVYSAPLEIIDSNPIGGSGNVLSSTLFSFLQSSPHDLTNQNHIMAGFPTLPVMQGEILDELHGGHQLTNHSGFATSNAMVSKSSQLDIIVTGDTLVGKPSPPSNEIEGRFMAGMPISAGRYGHHGNFNDIESLGYSGHQREVPEMLASNEYADIVQSSYGTSVDYTYDAMFGNVNCRWDSLKFSAQYAGTVPQRTGFEAYQNMDHSRWISPENNMSSDNTSGSSKYSNELSLSLSTSQPGTICGTTIMERCSGISGAVISSESFHGKQFGMEQTSYNNKSHSSSYGKKPVQLSELSSGSRFLNEMQQILAEIARYSLGNSNPLSYPTSGAVAEENSFSFNLSSEKGKTVIGPVGNGHLSSEQKAAAKKHLLDLLQTVDNRYKHSLDEIHKVISAFHAVTELDPQIHARFALQTISLLYKSLRERISNYILSVGAHMNEGDRPEEEMSFETSFIQKQWALQQLRQKDHQFWRPQRGLPERSVSVLRAWMFQNFLHPYPKDADKHLLAIKSGLTRSQVSNWFINARVRLWKPMIDEMYSEMNRRKACRNGEETNSQHRSHLNLSNQRFRTI